MKKVFKVIFCITLMIILISILYQKIYQKKDLVSLFGYSILIVNTGSMEPTIRQGDCIIIKESDKYKVDDIITYLDKEGFCITHRIINYENDEIITKGDFNNMQDEPINENQIKGKVIYHMNFIKLLICFILFLSVCYLFL